MNKDFLDSFEYVEPEEYLNQNKKNQIYSPPTVPTVTQGDDTIEQQLDLLMENFGGGGGRGGRGGGGRGGGGRGGHGGGRGGHHPTPRYSSYGRPWYYGYADYLPAYFPWYTPTEVVEDTNKDSTKDEPFPYGDLIIKFLAILSVFFIIDRILSSKK